MYQPKPFVVEFFPADHREPSNGVSEHATMAEARAAADHHNRTRDPYTARHYPGTFRAIPNPSVQ